MLKRIRKRIRNRAGFSLTELLASLLILAMVTEVVAGGLPAAARRTWWHRVYGYGQWASSDLYLVYHQPCVVACVGMPHWQCGKTDEP